MLSHWIKNTVRRAFGALGYSIRGVGNGVNGIDLLRDARIILGDSVNEILFDVGANIGQTTRAMMATFRSPRIFAFEPSPTSFKNLQEGLGGEAGVAVEPLALGSAAGELPFHVTQDHSVNDSLLAPAWRAGGSVVEVRGETVTGYCQRNGIDKIGLLKVDAQGYDLEVLRGARPMLEARRIKLFSCEANFEHLYQGQTNLRELLTFAEEVDYRLVGFYEQTYVKGRLSYLDALFCAG